MGKRTDSKLGAFKVCPSISSPLSPFGLPTRVQPGKPARLVRFGLCHHPVSAACMCGPSQTYACPNRDQNLRQIEPFTSMHNHCLPCASSHACAIHRTRAPSITRVPLTKTQERPLTPAPTACHTLQSWEGGSEAARAKAPPRHCSLAVLTQHSII